MRFCPRKSEGEDSNCRMKLAAFEKACHLTQGIGPGPNSRKWIMRWRGKAGGLLVDRHVGGENDANCGVDFMRDVPSGTEHFRGMKIQFCFCYEHNLFIFDALKTANLTEEAFSPSVPKDKWDALWNSDWGDLDDDLEGV